MQAGCSSGAYPESPSPTAFVLIACLHSCQTCPQAFCEDCLPFNEITALGSTIPEFKVCSFPAQTSSYFIRCVECLELFEEQPELWQGWLQEWEEAEARIKLMLDAEEDGR